MADDNNDTVQGIYFYDPSVAAAIIFASLFAITSIGHIVQLVRTRTWYMIPFILGCLGETVGYAARAVSAKQNPNYTVNPYIIQALTILISPAFLAASVYMVLGRIILLLDAGKLAIIRPRFLTKIFVVTDVLSLLVQAGGGAMLAGASTKGDLDELKLGENVIIAGLFIQLLAFSLFIVVAALFHRKARRHLSTGSKVSWVPWEKNMYVLYGVSALILVRSFFRAIEYLQGVDGSIQKSEAFLYVLDATFMTIATAAFLIFHPSKIISKGSPIPDGVYESSSELQPY